MYPRLQILKNLAGHIRIILFHVIIPAIHNGREHAQLNSEEMLPAYAKLIIGGNKMTAITYTIELRQNKLLELLLSAKP